MSHPYEWAGAALIVAGLFLPLLPFRFSYLGVLASAAGILVYLCGDIATRQWTDVGVDVVVIAWVWWRSRPRGKRRKTTAVLGAKAKAARDALVRRAREVAQPRPVLRPVPVPS